MVGGGCVCGCGRGARGVWEGCGRDGVVTNGCGCVVGGMVGFWKGKWIEDEGKGRGRREIYNGGYEESLEACSTCMIRG